MNLIVKQILCGLVIVAAVSPAFAKSQKAHKRIVAINLGGGKVANKRQPAKVNGKTITYIPQSSTVSKKIVNVDRHASDIGENSYDPLIEKLPNEKSFSKKRAPLSREPSSVSMKAEIDGETLRQVATPAVTSTDGIGSKTKKRAEQAILEDYY